MNRNDALKMILADYCCRSGKEYCELCPLQNEDCVNIHFEENDLLEAVKLLSEEVKNFI